MPLTLTPRQRALRCVRWQPYDAVPIYSPVPFSPQAWAEGRLAPWQDNDRYREVAGLVAQHCVLEGRHRAHAGRFSRSFLLIPDEYVHPQPPERVDDQTFRTTIVRTPRGDLRTVARTDHRVNTTWMVEPLPGATSGPSAPLFALQERGNDNVSGPQRPKLAGTGRHPTTTATAASRRSARPGSRGRCRAGSRCPLRRASG